MTKTEAIQQMQKGVRITHEWFSDQEWMTIKDGKILLEDGLKCSSDEFWSYRTNESWNDGYSLFKPQL